MIVRTVTSFRPPAIGSVVSSVARRTRATAFGERGVRPDGHRAAAAASLAASGGRSSSRPPRSFSGFPAYRGLAASSSSCDSTATTNQPPVPVAVYDNVLSPACREELTSEALYNIGPEVYRRDDGSASPQDVLIESILQGLGFDGTREVEWWGRSIYKSVEAHRDVDEEAATARGERRYPTHSLIVYLDMEEGMRAPTCVWVPTDSSKATATANGSADTIGKSAFVSVPAVPGRMLVFSGELLHAVPCPTLGWLDPMEDHDAVLDSGGGTAGGMRRVLVLNLWDDYAPEDEEEDWEEEWDDEEEEDDDEEMPIIEFFAKKVECEPRTNWQPIPLQGPAAAVDDSAPLGSAPTLHNRSHGSDEPLLSPLIATSREGAAAILEGESVPQWVWTGADVRDLGIGVPSLAGLREERTRLFE